MHLFILFLQYPSLYTHTTHYISLSTLAPSVASATSVANNKDDNEMILGDVHRYPGIFLTAEENLRKRQLGDRLIKGLYDQSPPQMWSLSSK